MGDESSRRVVHVLWSKETGPLIAYTRTDKAHGHAMTISGVEVTSCELRDDYPESVSEDIYVAELEDIEDATPVEIPEENDRTPDERPKRPKPPPK